MKLSIIIPAYNEEKRLPKTLKAMDEYLRPQTYEYEMIVVNDGSKDRTAEVVREMAPQIKGLHLIDNKINQGKGGSVIQGMLAAKGEVRLFTDADHSTSIDHLEKIWPKIDEGYEIVIGTRDARDAEDACQAVPQPLYKRLAGDVGNIVIQILFPVLWGIWDTQCGFKAFSQKATEDVFSKLKIKRWAFDVEALALAKKMNYKVAIIPTFWKNDPESTFKLKGYIRFFKEVMIIKWNFLTRKYG